MKASNTERGFRVVEFVDGNGDNCSLQESSHSEPHIWLGSDEDQKRHHVTGQLMSCRMHLNQKQVKELLPLLQHFAEYGNLPKSI